MSTDCHWGVARQALHAGAGTRFPATCHCNLPWQQQLMQAHTCGVHWLLSMPRGLIVDVYQ